MRTQAVAITSAEDLQYNKMYVKFQLKINLNGSEFLNQCFSIVYRLIRKLFFAFSRARRIIFEFLVNEGWMELQAQVICKTMRTKSKTFTKNLLVNSRSIYSFS